MYFTNLEGTILIKANSKLDALKNITNIIYFKGNKPYGLPYIGSKNEIHLYKANVYKGKKCYTLFYGEVNKITKEEEIVKFDLNFNYIKRFRF